MNSSEIVTLAKQIIEQNCSAPNFSIAHLASMMHFHEVYLRKLFHLQLGKSPRAVLKELRMVKARSLLENGELSVAEVAAAVGILDPSYFSQCYKQYYGYPPSKERGRHDKATADPDAAQKTGQGPEAPDKGQEEGEE